MTIGLAHYSPHATGELNGFGIDQSQAVGDLSKALQAGFQVTNQTGGSALRVESLEGSLKVVTYTAHHIKFWKKIPKSPAYSTVEEYNQLTDYGNNAFAFVGEGELPPTQDTTYARRTSLVKFLGTTREVTHPMTVVHPAHGDVIALENQNGILWVLERIENALFQGDASLAFDGEAEQWDGLNALIDPTSFIDLEGQPLQEADVEEGANQLVESFAYPTDLWLGTRVASDLVKTFYPKERVQLPAPQNGMVGMSVNSVMTQAGVMELNPNVFLQQLPNPPAAATSASAPAAITSVTAAVNAGVTDGDFNKGSAAGINNYSYCVTAANRFGESAPVLVAASDDISQAQKDAFRRIDLTVTNAAAIGAFPPEYFRVYRTAARATGAAVPADLTLYSLILQVPATSQAGSGVTTINDVNFMLPFTEIAYMGEMTPSVLTFRQLLPMLRMDLAILAPAFRWMILLYGTPILFAPLKFLRFINVGRLARA
jgi:hypothetical protein